MTNKNEVIAEALKTAPPVSVAGATVAGASLDEWVLILTAVYTVLQLAYFLRKRYKEYKDGSL